MYLLQGFWLDSKQFTKIALNHIVNNQVDAVCTHTPKNMRLKKTKTVWFKTWSEKVQVVQYLLQFELEQKPDTYVLQTGTFCKL